MKENCNKCIYCGKKLNGLTPCIDCVSRKDRVFENQAKFKKKKDYIINKD